MMADLKQVLKTKIFLKMMTNQELNISRVGQAIAAMAKISIETSPWDYCLLNHHDHKQRVAISVRKFLLLPLERVF